MSQILKEGVFKFNQLSKEEQDEIYNVFKTSYEKSTGASWDQNKFTTKASNWSFFGDKEGYISVREQNSGLYKLVGVAGNIKSILNGLNELQSLNLPAWGMVSSEIQKMTLKKGFKTPPAFLLKILLKTIPKSVFGGTDFDINSDGSLTLKYSDVGDARKYFIGNKEYFKKLKSDILPTLKDKISNITLKGVETFLNENIDLDEARTNPEKNIELPLYNQINQFIEKHKNNEDLIFISFRNSINTTFINPKNSFDTPTGLYTYPWKNYYKIKYEEQVKNNLLRQLSDTVPYAGDRKFMFIYKLKSLNNILHNESKWSDTLPYAKKLLDIFSKNEKVLEIVNAYVNDYQRYVNDYYKNNLYYNSNTPEIHSFWVLLYEVAILISKTKIQNTVSSICRKIGVDGFMDFGTGFIHPNERYQAVFFKGGELFEDYKIIDIHKNITRLTSPHSLTKEVMNKLSDVKNLREFLENSNNKKELVYRLLSNSYFNDFILTDKLIPYLSIDDKSAKMLLNNNNALIGIDRNGLSSILDHVGYHNDVIYKLIANDVFMANADLSVINLFFSYVNDQNELIDVLFDNKNFKNRVDADFLSELFRTFTESVDTKKYYEKILKLDKMWYVKGGLLDVTNNLLNNVFSYTDDDDYVKNVYYTLKDGADEELFTKKIASLNAFTIKRLLSIIGEDVFNIILKNESLKYIFRQSDYLEELMQNKSEVERKDLIKKYLNDEDLVRLMNYYHLDLIFDYLNDGDEVADMLLSNNNFIRLIDVDMEKKHKFLNQIFRKITDINKFYKNNKVFRDFFIEVTSKSDNGAYGIFRDSKNPFDFFRLMDKNSKNTLMKELALYNNMSSLLKNTPRPKEIYRLFPVNVKSQIKRWYDDGNIEYNVNSSSNRKELRELIKDLYPDFDILYETDVKSIIRNIIKEIVETD